MSSQNFGMAEKPSYFLVAVSTRENLELCIRYSLAGLPSGVGGAWTFCEIQQGDFISFLYGARAYNLYIVDRREAICNPEQVPPWKPITSEKSHRTRHFPFRLYLRPIRKFVESIVRDEFSYVAENLLLRGGYRKTHFQADQTTLQRVSEMGIRAQDSVTPLVMPAYDTFTPRFTQNKELKTAEVFRFQETILQSAIRRHLVSDANLQILLSHLMPITAQAADLEILGEKAITQGHIDLLLKKRVPLGSALKIPIEVKTKKAQPKDLNQLLGYMRELEGDCPTGVLIAADFNKHLPAKATENGIALIRYAINVDLKRSPTFEEIYETLELKPLEK